jgi:hypothetical protein
MTLPQLCPNLELTDIPPSNEWSGQSCVLALSPALRRKWFDPGSRYQRQQDYGHIRRKCS